MVDTRYLSDPTRAGYFSGRRLGRPEPVRTSKQRCS